MAEKLQIDDTPSKSGIDEKSSLLEPIGVEGDDDPPVPNTTYWKLLITIHKLIFGKGFYGTIVEFSILFIILINVVAFIVSTVHAPEHLCDGKSYDECILGEVYEDVFETIEIVSIIIFTIEYTLAVWSSIGDAKFYNLGPVFGRLRYMISFLAIIDLIAILPFYILLFVGDINDASFATAIRGLRLVRLLAAERYLHAFGILVAVIKDAGDMLVLSSAYSLIFLIVFSTLLYYSERDLVVDGEPLGEIYYNSIPEAMYATLLQLTGDLPNDRLSSLGKVISSIIALGAVAFFAVPTAILGQSFVKALQEATHEEGDDQIVINVTDADDNIIHSEHHDNSSGHFSFKVDIKEPGEYLIEATIPEEELDIDL